MSPSADEERTQIRAADPNPFPCLEVLAGPKGLGRYPLRPGKNYIGRSPDNDIVLDDSSVSRRHAEVQMTPEAVVVTDLGSRNGTRVAGQKIGEPVPLGHETRVRIGLFQMRLLLQEAPPAEPEPVEQEPEAPGGIEEEQPPPPGEEDIPLEEGEGLEEAAPPRRIPRWLFLAAGGAVLLVAAVFATPRVVKFLTGDREATVSEEARLPEKEGEVGGVVSAERVPVPTTAPQRIPVFLDFSSTPVPAQVWFGDQRMGVTPFRVSSTLKVGNWYEARALFELPEVGEVLEEKLQFSPPEGATILPINFVGKIGIFKVAGLPRAAELYLEGYFEKEPYRAKPIKFAEIVYGKPIYVPYGRYLLELRKSRQIELSQTFLDEVVYRREFFINPEQTNYTVKVTDEDLKVFPVEIRSIPPVAKVFIDGNDVGATPFTGTFPVGEHLLTLKKDGYFDFSQVIKMEVNAQYLAEIQLQTSEAGELINKAAALMKEDHHVEALPLLAEAFGKKPGPREIAQISYLVGVCYLRQKQFDQAKEYFVRATEHPDYRYAARVGLSEMAFDQGDAVRSLQLLVEVLVSSEDPQVRAEAGRVFQRVSPLRSVLYVTSDPAGARVLVNGQEIGQATPLILHDLGVGAYRVQVLKDGFEPSELKLNIGVSEFRPIVVKMKKWGQANILIYYNKYINIFA